MEDEEVIISDTAFDVPTDNYDELEEDIRPEKLGDKLLQINSQKGITKEFQFYDDKYLLISILKKNNSKAVKFHVSLSTIKAEPEHNKTIIWKWLYLAVACFTSSIFITYLTLNDLLRIEYSIAAGSIMLTSTVIFILLFLYYIKDEYLFKGNYSGAHLFSIENKKPEQQDFDKFFICLQQHIDRAQASLSIASRLVEELKMCRRLRDKGIINEDAYTIARTAIFKHDQYRA